MTAPTAAERAAALVRDARRGDWNHLDITEGPVLVVDGKVVMLCDYLYSFAKSDDEARDKIRAVIAAAITAAEAEAERRGAAAERARIVASLRTRGEEWAVVNVSAMADEIERGEL